MTSVRVLLLFCGAAAVVACASLKEAAPEDGADASTDAPPGSTGGEGGADASSVPGADGGGPLGEGGAGNGDPRWPQWRLPADAPDSASYTLTNGPEGAIVVDKVTGLAWQDTLALNGVDFAGAGAYCDGLVYDGQSDWRVPTRIEAISIMSFKPAFDESAVAGPAFSTASGPASQCYWTSSLLAQSTNTAYSVNVAGISFTLTDTKCIVRCVRGGPALGTPMAKQFVLAADTVTDPTTGLVWEKSPPETETTQANADARCKALVLGGKQMRLPGVKELASIVDETKKEPALSGAFGSYSVRMFTSNPYWTVDFNDGVAIQGPTSFSHYSRCVSGP